MDDTKLLSVCLFGAGLCTAVTLLMQHPARFLEGAKVAIVDKGVPSTRTEVVMTVEASPKPAVQVPSAPKPTKKPQAPTPKDVDVTGSVKPTAKNNQGQYLKAESKFSTTRTTSAHKRRYGWEPYTPWPADVYPYSWDEYPEW